MHPDSLGEQIAYRVSRRKYWVDTLSTTWKRELFLSASYSHMMVNQKTLDLRMGVFRSCCAERGLSLTHQRWVIYRTLARTDRHPTPEWIFEQVRREIPSISLATIYNNIKIFRNAGLLREVSTPDQTMRLDANVGSHHHLVCRRCGTILDLPGDSLAPFRPRKSLPRGFRVEGQNIDFLGRCGQCRPQVRTSG